MTAQKRAIVVGGGTWGLPAALRLQDSGWHVTVLERFEPGGPYASAGGSSRLWRLADTQIWRSRAMLGTLHAMERLSERLGEPIFRRTGALWRDDQSLPDVIEALESIGQSYERVPADRVTDFFPGLRPDGRDALFVTEAGIVHADRLLSGVLREFIAAGGEYRPGTRAARIDPAAAAAQSEQTARVELSDGSILEAEQVLVSAGPGTAELLPGLGLTLPLTPYIEQVIYVGDPALSPPAPDLPGLVDCTSDEEPGVYAMPNGDAGYKIGLDVPLRALHGGSLGEDLDRAERPERTEIIRARVERDLTAIEPTVLATQVCTWTDSGDGDFIVGRVEPTVVLACGDSGEGFKYSAFMGEYLADLVMGGLGDAEYQRYWDPYRFGENAKPRKDFDPIGRH